MVPAAAAACSVPVPDTQIVAPVEVVIVGMLFTVATTAVLGLEVQPLFVTAA
jgi:hypothetical protein